MSTIIEKFRKTEVSIHRLDVMGGTDSLFGKEHIFSQLLHDEHEKAGLTDNGMYCFKGLNWYGNIISWEPTLATIGAFLAHGFVRADLEALRDWWKGVNQTLDTACLSSYLDSAMKRDDIKELLAEAEKTRARFVAEEGSRLAAIPHLAPPEGALPYVHLECLEDFAGNSSQPGAWADVFVNESGQEVVTFGGCWVYYTEGDDVLSKFMEGERGCPVEARPAKVKQLKAMSAETNEDSFSRIVAFLEKNHSKLRFGEELKWEGKG